MPRLNAATEEDDDKETKTAASITADLIISKCMNMSTNRDSAQFMKNVVIADGAEMEKEKRGKREKKI